MATAPTSRLPPDSWYPDSDGKPMAETPEHRDNLTGLIEMLRDWFRNEALVYVTGNVFLYYVPGDQRKHVSPDVFVVRGIPKTPERRCYLVWKEKKSPDVVIELTSKSTRKEDLETKLTLYRDTLKVREYFLFDPLDEYLDPPLQGFRLSRGKYAAIRAVHGRLPSKVLGLHLERDGWQLRLYDPATGEWVPTPRELVEEAEAAQQQAEMARQQAETARQQAEMARQQEVAARARAEAEIERLRREVEALQRRLPRQP